MTNIGILAEATKEGGGVYQYTQSLIESLLKYTQYNYVIIKKNELTISEIKYIHHYIEIKDPPNILLKLKRIIYLKVPNIKKFIDVSGDYKIIKNSNLKLIIVPNICPAPIYLDIPYIVTIHDLQHKYYPKFFAIEERLTRDFVYENVAKNAFFVICESNFVKKDIIKFLNIPESKILVITSPPPQYLAKSNINTEKLRDIKVKYNLPDKFMFYPANFWNHKNHMNLIKSIGILKNEYKEKIFLILVGSKKDNFENTSNTAKALNLEDQVRWLGYIPEDDMPYLYKLSTALVMPSFFESVSMPIWEAFFLGCPVVSSNVCALPEQVGNAGLLFNPNIVEDIAEKIFNIWTDATLREELIQKGFDRVKDLNSENYAKNWENVIKYTLDKI